MKTNQTEIRVSDQPLEALRLIAKAWENPRTGDSIDFKAFADGITKFGTWSGQFDHAPNPKLVAVIAHALLTGSFSHNQLEEVAQLAFEDTERVGPYARVFAEVALLRLGRLTDEPAKATLPGIPQEAKE